jgi:murein DD-endopeptidase MepM/ murein hydrolase activator NlpD
MLFGSLLSSAIVLSIVLLVVAPLANGQHQGGIFSAIQNIAANGLWDPFQPSSHTAAPTPAPQATIPAGTAPMGEGYCGGKDLWGTCATAQIASGVMATGQMVSPIKGAVITQVFGNNEYQLVCGCWRPHSGIDLAAAYGTPITAADSGQVLWAGWDLAGQ